MTDRSRARGDIFGKVRSGLGVVTRTVADRSRIERRLAQAERHLVPARVAGKAASDYTAILRRWLEAASGSLIEIADEAALPAAIAAYLRAHNMPARIRIGDDPLLAGLSWHTAPAIEVERGRAAASDTASVTHALAAIAETGTVLVASGPDNPVTLSFLPETNIAVVRRADVVGSLEDAWARVRTAGPGGAGLPRTLNMISGPSRSADVGGIPVLGAHGPKRFCLIIVG